LIEKHPVLLYLAILTVASKSLLIPYFIRTIQRKMRIKRDLEFRYLTPISSIFVTLMLTLTAYVCLSKALTASSAQNDFYLGAVLGVSLALMGMMVIFSRRKVITKIVGYLMMENGVLLFGMFLTELPFIVEAMIVVDLIILVLIAAILAVGMDASIEEFQARLNVAHKWFTQEKEDDEI
jgi:hydrogenase-4 component E